MACVHYFFSSSLPFTIRPPQPSLPVSPEPPAVPARREIGSERGTGILPQLTEPCQAQAALLPATSLGTGGRGAAGGCRGLAALPRHCAPQPPPRLRCQMPNGGRKRGDGRERSWLRPAQWWAPTRDPFPLPRPAGLCPHPSAEAPEPVHGAGVTWRGSAPQVCPKLCPQPSGESPSQGWQAAPQTGDAARRGRLPQTHLLPSIRLLHRGAREIGKGRTEEGLVAMGGGFGVPSGRMSPGTAV